jgi:hypothetical protein
LAAFFKAQLPTHHRADEDLGDLPFVAAAVGGAGFVDGEQRVSSTASKVWLAANASPSRSLPVALKGRRNRSCSHIRIDVADPHRAGGDEGGGFAGFRQADEHDGRLLQSHHPGDRADEGKAQQQLQAGIADGEAGDFPEAVQVAAGAVAVGALHCISDKMKKSARIEGASAHRDCCSGSY